MEGGAGAGRYGATNTRGSILYERHREGSVFEGEDEPYGERRGVRYVRSTQWFWIVSPVVRERTQGRYGIYV